MFQLSPFLVKTTNTNHQQSASYFYLTLNYQVFQLFKLSDILPC